MGEVPGLWVLPGPEDVLRALEADVVRRSRQLDDAGLPDALAYRRAHPEDPLPAVIAFLGEVPAGWDARFAATVAAGAPLGLGAVLLGAGRAARARLRIGTDHVVVDVEPAELAETLGGARLFALTAVEATDVLGALADAEERPSSEDDEPGDSGAAGAASSEAWPEPSGRGVEDAARPIQLRLLGGYQIIARGQVVATGLRSAAKQLLAWYTCRPEGASIEAAVEALWPGTDPKGVHRQFWLAASNLRTRLRAAAGEHVKVLISTGEVYRAETETIACDLWDFQDALAEATRADDDASARNALHRAVEAYGGEFAQGLDYRWAEPLRVDFARRALDACVRLAELEERHGDPDAAAAVLERAIALDGYAEEPCRRLMATQGRLGRPDAVAATWEALQRRLQEIDIEPEPVKTFETKSQDFFCRSLWTVGLLIQATVGSLGGEGRRPQKR
ncbi:MAG: AfsR/SARP family transcriptional regulator, partial [Acidimicrobiales bacterium]